MYVRCTYYMARKTPSTDMRRTALRSTRIGEVEIDPIAVQAAYVMKF